MTRVWLAVAAIGGFLSVAAGAAAAHLTAGDARAGELLRTGALYGMIHAAALIGVAAMAERRPNLPIAVAGWGFAIGIPMFSLSLFALALTGIARFGLVTPFGGGAFLIGWAALGLSAVRRK